MKQGFLLIELVISIALLSSIAATLAYYQWHTVLLYQEATMYTKVLHAATNWLEEIVETQQLPSKNNVEHQGYTLRLSHVQLPVPTFSNNSIKKLVGKDNPHFAYVKLDVTWQSLTGKQKNCAITTGCILKSVQ